MKAIFTASVVTTALLLIGCVSDSTLPFSSGGTGAGGTEAAHANSDASSGGKAHSTGASGSDYSASSSSAGAADSPSSGVGGNGGADATPGAGGNAISAGGASATEGAGGNSVLSSCSPAGGGGKRYCCDTGNGPPVCENIAKGCQCDPLNPTSVCTGANKVCCDEGNDAQCHGNNNNCQ